MAGTVYGAPDWQPTKQQDFSTIAIGTRFNLDLKNPIEPLRDLHLAPFGFPRASENRGGKMWNRILGKSNDSEKSPSTSERRRESKSQLSTLRRTESLKSTTSSSRKTAKNEECDRGFNPTSTSYSSTTQNQHPGTASASIGTSFATASNDPTNDPYLPPGLIRNASLANQIPKSAAGDDERAAALGSSSRSMKEESSSMDPTRERKERRGARPRDDDRRESRSSREKPRRRDSKKEKERAVSIDETAYIDNDRRDRAIPASDGRTGSSSMPLAGQSVASRPESVPGQQSSHVQHQFPGQFPAGSATPYRPPLAASEGGPGLAAEYYGDAGQSVAEQPGFRIHSPSLIVGAEPHLQAASAVVAPPPEPSALGGVGAAASFFDDTFSAGSDVEDHHVPKPTSTAGSSITQYSSAAPLASTYTTSSSNPPNQHSSSAPVIPTLGAAAAGAAADYYMSNHPSKPERPEHASSSISGYGGIAGSSNHQQADMSNRPSNPERPERPEHASSSISGYGGIAGSSSYQQSATAHDQYTSYSSTSRPPAKPGKHFSQSSNTPLYAAGAAGGLAGAAYHHNHHDGHHGSAQNHSQGHHHGGSSMAQEHGHRHGGPLSTLVDFFKDPDGVAQFEEYTEYIGVCRHCFAPGSSPRDAPRRHRYRRRRSKEKTGSSVRVDKDSRYWSSENESRRRKNKSWLGAGIAGYGLAKVGASLFKQDRDFNDSRTLQSGTARRSHRRGSSSSSSDRKSRTLGGRVRRSTDTLSRRSRSNDRAETGITSDGKLYRKDSHGNIHTSAVKDDTSRRRASSRSRDRASRISDASLGAVIGTSVVASTSRRRSRSPKKAPVRSKHDGENKSELASVLRLDESDARDRRRRAHHSPDSTHRKGHRKEKKNRGFFTFSNGSSSSSGSSNLAFEASHERTSAKSTRSKKKDKSSREADAALLGLGAAAAALALNQNQRSKHKGELLAVKESKGKNKLDEHGRKGKKSSSSSEEDMWESASEGEWSSADSELAYGASLHRRSRESLSSDSSGLDKWSWRWGSKKQSKKPTGDRRKSSEVDRVSPEAATIAMGIDASQVPTDGNRQDSRMTSNSSMPLQHLYPMPTSDPTQFDVARHDAGLSSHQPYINPRPDPVPIQHPQPVAPVSPAVYTTQSSYPHSYSAPTGPPSLPQHQYPATVVSRDASVQLGNQAPDPFPTGNEYFEPFMKDSKKDPKPRRRDSSPVTRTSEYTSSSRPRRRKSLKDDSSSVRFDLTKEQEDKDRREERRRRKEEDKRRERLEHQEIEDRKTAEQDRVAKRDISSKVQSYRDSREESADVRKESRAAPATAGVIAAVIGATVAAKRPSEDQRHRDWHDEPVKGREERDIEAIVKERHAPVESTASEENNRRGRSSKKEPMSVWQAAAKIKRSSSHTEYAAYFTPPELLEKSSDVKQIVGPNADSDITIHQVPHVVTVEPSEYRGHSPSRAYSFPITAEDMEHGKKPLPWSVPSLNLVEPTPPSSRSGSIAGRRSPQSRSPLSKEVVADIPMEPLESISDGPVTFAEPEHVEYTVIEPKERSTPSTEPPVSEVNLPDAIPGISSLKNRKKRKGSRPKADYGDDIDFAATVAAGLQDTGFDPSIVVDDPSFRRRDSPPGSEEGRFQSGSTPIVTGIISDDAAPTSPPHGVVEDISEHHMPGSFDDDEEQIVQPSSKSREEDTSTDYATGPSDNAGVKPTVHSIEPVPTEPAAMSNAAVDPVGDSSYNRREAATHEGVTKEHTEPSDDVSIKPHVYTAEPESFELGNARDVNMDLTTGGQQSVSTGGGSPRGQPLVDETAYSSPDKVDYPSDDAQSVAATAPVISSSSKSKKKSKRRSVGFDDTTSTVSAPATFEDTQEASGKPQKGRKGGIFGMFSRSTESLPESKGSQEIPVEANLEDFEEPKKRSKKSKSRKTTLDDNEAVPGATDPTTFQEPEAQDDWSRTKKPKRGKEKRRNSEQVSGRITQDLPAQVIAPASPSYDPLSSPNEMLTNPEDPKADHDISQSGSGIGVDDTDDRSRAHGGQEPSFLGERPENPPLPDLPDASEDPGGQLEVERALAVMRDAQPSESSNESPATKADKQKWRLSDLQSDGRSVSHSSPSPTAVPIRPLRFGRRPSSPGLDKSLPSTPQPSSTTDLPFTPRRRERPHSTEFKSNEFRPIWLLEKHGSRQESAPQETYPSLPSSHTTSRSSSVHEADDSFQTEALNLAVGDHGDPAYRGLAIDISHGVSDSDLLDSQQATPTAASFHSALQEGNDHKQEIVPEASHSQAEFADVVSTPDVSGDPLEPARNGRLLHGIDDLFPQHRVPSPSRYDAGIDIENSREAEDRAPSPPKESKQESVGFTTMLKDATWGAFTGGSAAALLKSSSQHDEQLQQTSNRDSIKEISKDQEDLPLKSADKIPGRPTAEELRLLQEQDAQDAVDSWFAPAQAKRTKSRKGKKRGESLEAADTPAEPSKAVIEDVPFTTEPTETPLSPQPEAPLRESSTEAANVDWQRPLMTRRDSKGKKKKNKKKSTDSWEDKSVLPDEPTVEQRPEILAEPVDGRESSGLPVDAEKYRELEALSSTAQIEESSMSSKKNRKGKKKNRQLFLAEPTPEDILQEPSANQSAKEAVAEDPGVSADQPDVPIVPTAQADGFNKIISEDVPHDFPSSQGPTIEVADDTLLPNKQPTTQDNAHESDQSIEPSHELPLDPMLEEPVPEESATQQFSAGAPMADDIVNKEVTDTDDLPSKSFMPAALGSQLSPESIPLPLDDDIDLVQSPPDAPVLQPVDVAQMTGDVQFTIDKGPDVSAHIHEPSDEQPLSILKPAREVTELGDSGSTPVVLAEAISYLNLPENATMNQIIESPEDMAERKFEAPENQPDDEWANFTAKKGKKGKKTRKNKAVEAENEEDVVALQTPNEKDTLPQAYDHLTMGQGLREERAILETDESNIATATLKENKDSTEMSELGRFLGETITEPVAEDEERPTSSKKKKKGRRSKNVQFDEPEATQPEELHSSAALEPPSTTTNTAEDAKGLLQASEPERESEEVKDTATNQLALRNLVEENQILSHDHPEGSSQTETEKGPSPLSGPSESLIPPQADPREIVVERQPEVAEWELPADQDLALVETAVASTGTAAEVQRMLAEERPIDTLPAPVGDTAEESAQPTETDDFAWASSEKKGKKSKSFDDVEADAETLGNPQLERDSEGVMSVPKEVPVDEPIEEFSVKKSKKDKKSKRKSLSRSVSDIQDEQKPQGSATFEEPTEMEEMSITNDAPSIVEKTDQLPSIEMPTTPEAAPADVLSDTVIQSNFDKDGREQDISEPLQAVDVALPPSPQENVMAVESVPKDPEMELSTEAPPGLEKQEDLPSLESPALPEAVRHHDVLDDSDRPISTSDPEESLEGSAPIQHEHTRSLPNPEATMLPFDEAPAPVDPKNTARTDFAPSLQGMSSLRLDNEQLSSPNPTNVQQIFDHKSISRSEERLVDQPVAPADDTEELILQPTASKKDKKKSKKAEALAWDDEIPVDASEQGPQSKNDPLNLTTVPALEPTIEEASAKSKKDKKKSKKAKALAWEDKPSETSIEDGESQQQIVDPVREQSVEPVVEDGPVVVEEASESKKDKKKIRKAKALGWGDDAPEASREIEFQQEADNIVAQEPIISVEKYIGAVEEAPKSKKEKKKSKKSKSLSWEEDEPTTPRDEPQQPEIVWDTTDTANEQSSNVTETPQVEENFKDADEQPASRKSKKKGKKSKSIDWDQEPSSALTPDETNEKIPTSMEQEAIIEQPVGVVSMLAEDAADVPDDQIFSKKSKKKSKKAKSVAWDDEPSIPTSRDETEEAQSITDAQATETGSDVQPPMDVGALEIDDFPTTTSRSRKDKKKAKKSQALAWEEPPESILQDPAVSDITREFIDEAIQPAEAPGIEVLGATDEAHPNLVTEPEVDTTNLPRAEPETDPLDEYTTSVRFEADQQASQTPLDETEVDQDRAITTIHNAPPPTIDVQTPEDVSTHPTQPSNVDTEPNFPPSTDDALKAAEESIPLPSETTFADPSPLPEKGVEETLNSIPAPTAADVPKINEEQLPPPPEATTSYEADELADISRKPADSIPVPEAEKVNLAEECPSSSQKDKKQAKKAKRGMTWEYESADTTQEADLAAGGMSMSAYLEPEVEGLNHGSIEEPFAPAEPIATGAEKDFPSVSKKDEKKAKRGKKAPTWDEESTTPAESKPIVEVLKEESTPALWDAAETAEDFSSTSKKDKKKSKKSKKALAVDDDEASLSTTPAEPDLAREALGEEVAEKPQVPEASAAEAAETIDGFPLLSKKDKKKAKKSKKSLAFDDDIEPSLSSTPAESEAAIEVFNQVAESLHVPEPGAVESAETFEDFTSLSRKDKKKAKKKTRSLAFDDEPCETTTPAELEVEGAISDQVAIDDPSIVAEPAELIDDFTSTSRKDKKKAKKNKKASAFDDEPSGTTTPADLDPTVEIINQAAEEPSLLAESSALSEEMTSVDTKERKKAKKSKKSIAFDEEPSASAIPAEADPAVEPLNGTAEEPTLPIDQSTAENEEFSLLSKKYRKKAKKGKKAVAFDDDDEPSRSATPVTPNPKVEFMDFTDVPPLGPESTTPADELSSLRKKDKKKAKKAKMASAWEDEDPEIAPTVVGAEGPVEELRVQAPTLPDLDHSENLDPSKPQDISFGTATLTNPVDENTMDREVVPDAEIDLPASSKKSKKDKKKAKKAQAFEGDDEVAVEFPLPVATLPITAPAKTEDFELPTTTAVGKTTDVLDQADAATLQSRNEEPKPIPVSDPLVPSPSALALAPRHEDPAAVEPAGHAEEVVPFMIEAGHDRSGSLQTPITPPPESSSQLPSDADVLSVAQESTDRSTNLAEERVVEERISSIAQEAPMIQDDDLSSFATSKKSKKGRKAKKQPIDWEDDTATPPAIVQETSRRGAEDTLPPSRPEMMAWPTEVRLNLTKAAVEVPEQPNSTQHSIHDPISTEVNVPGNEPPGPSTIAGGGRNDYFNDPSRQDTLDRPHSIEQEARNEAAAPPPESLAEGTRSSAEYFAGGDEISAAATTQAESAKEQVDQEATTAEQSRSQEVAAEPADDFEGFATKKKDKKSKRKQKKQVVDDVMWEFPSMDPPMASPVAEQAPSEQTLDPIRDATQREMQAPPTSEQRTFVEPENVAQEGLSREVRLEDNSLPGMNPTNIQDQPIMSEEPGREEAADDDWGSVPKRSKKGKKSKKNKEVERDEFLSQRTTMSKEPEAAVSFEDTTLKDEQPESEAPRQDVGQPEHQPSRDDTSAAPHARAGEAMATAAAIGAGFVAAEQLGRKESKKGKNNKKSRQASSSWAEPEEEPQTITDSPSQGKNQEDLSRAQTTERRRSSPIQAWHQYISPNQSPKQSELYEVEDDRPRSAGSARRRRSDEEQRTTPERCSPIEAWHQYNTPRHSPQHSETYDYEARPATDGGDRRSSKYFNRDSAVHVSDSPIVPQRSPVRRAMRDSGYPDTEASPVVGFGSEATPQAPSFEELREPSPVSSTTKDRSSVLFQSSPSTREEHIRQEERELTSYGREASDLHTHDYGDRGKSPQGAARSLDPVSQDNSARVSAQAESLAALSGLRGPGPGQAQARPSIFGGPLGISSDDLDHDGTNRRRLNTITEYSPEESPLHKKNRDLSDVGAPDHGVKTARRSGTPQAISKRRTRSSSIENDKGTTSTDDLKSSPSWPMVGEERRHGDLERSRSRGMEQRPLSHQSNISSLMSGPPKQREYERRSLSGASNGSVESINAIIRTPPDQMRSASGLSNRSSGTPPLRRSDRSISGDLRGANRKSESKKRAKQPEAESEIAAPPSLITPDPSKERRKSRVKEMADVFEGYGDFHGSPISPTRPPSMRRQQSMQVLELESKLDHLVSENRSLHDARQRAERGLEEAAHDRSQEVDSYREGIETRETWLRQKDTEISELKETLESLQSQVAHLNEVNEGLHASSRGLDDHQERYGQLEEEHADTHQRWQQSTRELEVLKDQHAQLSAGMEDIVRHEVSIAVSEKDAELHRLQSELETAKQQIRTLQAQILASKNSNGSSDSIVPDRDEDYFDAQCQSLCSHVQQWVLRFSKFSDSRACYLSSEITAEQIVDRMENAILDGSDPDAYLADRVKRRDVFMSMVMTMTWEFIFTRYLFGADREQRQKLKSLEKQLGDSKKVSMAMVHKWRATTLALLSKREQFVNQRAQDTEAVMHTIYDTLSTILPPPSHLVPQIQQSLRKVLATAVDLSIELRTQRAEYVMLPPLQPEYDTNGDLARKVFFNASLMNERGASNESNEDLESRQAVVRMVLFPLVVKKGDADEGEEIVVCPAQVLVARAEEEGKGKKSVRAVSAQGSRSVERGSEGGDTVMGNVF